MTTWSFYDTATGLFDGSTYSCDHDGFTEANARGRGIVEGRFDRLSQRVDVATGEVVEYQPPQPDADHEWRVDERRWKVKPDVAARREQHATAMTVIEEAEKLSGPRAVREALLMLLPEGAERRRITAIEDQIVESRASLLPPERKTI